MKAKKTILILLFILLVAEIGIVGVLRNSGNEDEILMQGNQETAPAVTEPAFTEIPETVISTEPALTEAPGETEGEAPTEPKEKVYTLSFAGDCTLGSTAKNWNNGRHFIQTIGENYDYPFANVREYFENDDFTMINLEGPLTDEKKGAAGKLFAFRGPTAYTRIMTGSSVEAVTLANNHSMDYGTGGYQSTTKVLGEAGIAYVEKNKTKLYTTESGLKIGMYAGAFDMTADGIKKGVASLRNSGAEIVICAFHWGNEGEYRPTADQQKIAKAAIDAGADIVYGHHPHVLQKIETYKKGIIFYSLGNFSFGGAALPGDFDTALLQLEVIRGENGKVRLGELDIIPCSVSSVKSQNNFQPTPLEEGSKAYERVLSKLDGTFTGPNLNVDYDKNEPTDPPATNPPAPPATEAPGGNGDENEGGGENPGGTTNPPASGGNEGGNTGGDTGGSEGGGEKPADPAPPADPPAQPADPAPPADPPAQPAPPADPAPPEGGSGEGGDG